MRFENDKMVLVYGTADAPAPSGAVAAGPDETAAVSITAAVQPRSPGHSVEIAYRVNGGRPVCLAAQQTGHDVVGKFQYFLAKLPPFKAGDHVEYTVIAHSPAGQVPAAQAAPAYPAAFHIAPSAQKAKTTVAPTAKSDPGHAPHPEAAASAKAPLAPPAVQTNAAMPKTQLLALAELSASSFREIARTNAALGQMLAQKISLERKLLLRKSLKNASPTLTAALEKLDFSSTMLTMEFRQAIDSGLAAQHLNGNVLREARRRLDPLERAGSLADRTDLAAPIEDVALFTPLLNEAAVYLLADAAKLPEASARQVIEAAPSPALIDDQTLASLIAGKVLTEAAAAALGLLASLYLMTGENARLAAAIKPKVTALPGLVELSAEDWLQAINDSKSRPPRGMGAKDYAAALRRGAANLYPSDALHALTTPTDTKPFEAALDALAPLFAKNPAVIGEDFSDLDISGLDPAQAGALRPAHAQLQHLANQHPGFQLAELLNGAAMPAAKMAAISARLASLAKLKNLNPSLELLGLDYGEGSADRAKLNTEGLAVAEQHMVTENLKACQRVHALTGDVDHTADILAAGYHSGTAIAIDAEAAFAHKTGLPHKLAAHYHQTATHALSRASNAAISAIDAYDGVFQRSRAGNVQAQVKDHLQSIPGFAALFGAQAYCNCTECQSILGAPAYFVDLMTFVEENLTGPVFRGKKARDALNLKIRRPDLWTLPLTCDNTNDLVSYLDIINPALEDYIAGAALGRPDHHPRGKRQEVGRKRQVAPAKRAAKVEPPVKAAPPTVKAGATERPSAATQVYGDILSKAQSSFQQPFVLPLEKLDIYLEHFSVPRLQIARGLGAAPGSIVKAALKISETLYQQLIDDDTQPDFIKRVYGIAFSFAGNGMHLDALDIETLLAPTGYARSDFAAAVTSRFVTRCGATKISIEAGKKNAESVQNDVERVHGLNADALHRLYRFTRLLRTTPWPIEELDLILLQLGAAAAPAGITVLTLQQITQLLDLRSRFVLPVDQSCALWSAIPTGLAGDNLFDRLFNFAPILATDERLPVAGAKFIHGAFTQSGTARIMAPAAPSTAGTGLDHRNTTQRILAALQIADADLIALITGLAPGLGVNLASQSADDFGFALSLENLSLLYRHAALARLLGIGMAQLFQLITFAGLAQPYVQTLDDLTALLGFYDWFQGSGYALDDLGVITQGPVLNPVAYPLATALAQRLVQSVTTAHALEFSDRIFVTLLGVTEAQSQQMIAANPALFAPVPGAAGTYCLTDSFRATSGLQFQDDVFAFLPGITAAQSQQIIAANPALFTASAGGLAAWQLSSSFNATSTIAIPQSTPLDAADAQSAMLLYSNTPQNAASALLGYHPIQVVPSLLSGLLGADTPTTAALLGMAGVDLTAAPIFAALQSGPAATPANLAPLTALIQQVIPLKILFAGAGLPPADLAFIQNNIGIFAITGFNALTVANIQLLAIYFKFAAPLAGTSTGTQPLRDVLAAYTAGSGYSSADPQVLAALAGIDARRLHGLLPHLTLQPGALQALTSLATAASLSASLGLGGEALNFAVSDLYAKQTMASNAVLSAFRARYADEQSFIADCQPFDDRVRERKRNALVDYLLTWHGYAFAKASDLYNYFLMDVQLQACMETSWVVAAASSVQLYVYRCLLGLEQNQRAENDPDYISVTLPEAAAEEWEWRQNYRVWQANREVFLYPENYILPELRDDMTPLFDDLQSALLQQPITEQNVLDAYATYLAGFDQLSKLRIAGSYHDIDRLERSDVLHLFGVTPADPPNFFYRTIENANYGETQADRAVTYTPWTPVDLKIECRKVSPIVYLGRLFVFWTQITSAPQNLVVNANSLFNGYKHSWRVKYAALRLDQSWDPPQQLVLNNPPVFESGNGVVEEPLLDNVDKDINGFNQHTSQLLVALATSNPSSAQSTLINTYPDWEKRWFDPNYSQSLTLATYQQTLIPQFGETIQTGSVDGYTLSGFSWDRVYPTVGEDTRDLLLTGRNFLLRGENVDFYHLAVNAGSTQRKGAGQPVLCSRPKTGSDTRDLYRGRQDHFPSLERYPWCSIITREEQIQDLAKTSETLDLYLPPGATSHFGVTMELVAEPATFSSGEPLKIGLYRRHIAEIPETADIAIVNSSARDEVTDAILDLDGDSLHLQGGIRGGSYVLKRLGTTLGESLCESLFIGGVDGLLALDTQRAMRETKPDLAIRDCIQDEIAVGKMDFLGAMGTYLREIFFFAPMLVATQLSNEGNFEAAQQWFRYVFDPSAKNARLAGPKHVRDAHAAHGQTHREDAHHHDKQHAKKSEDSAAESTDRVWRFIEFRDRDIPSLRRVLSDPAAVAAYAQDPFNPDAIARLRLSAYQKYTVMGYLTNLIAWGDTLFTDFEMETVNEATLLYVQASEILGPRPADVGDCGELNEDARTYARIAPLVRKGSDFLIEMETYTHSATGAARAQEKRRPDHKYVLDAMTARHHVGTALDTSKRHADRPHRSEKRDHPQAGNHAPADEHAAPKHGAARPYHWKSAHKSARTAAGEKHGSPKEGKRRGQAGSRHGARFAWSVARHVVPVFCVPPNATLLGFWDTIEDRLYKIRNGLDINGVRRRLSLFAPPINPLLLIEAMAAGIALDDVTGTTSGDAPPYRFSYLIDKAKQFASQVQGFGGALLSAMEKRDAQQLEVLRVTQQQNILTMTTASKQAEIDAAQNAIDVLNAQIDTAQFRHDYYQGLMQDFLNPFEVAETSFRTLAAANQVSSIIQLLLSGTIHLIPQLGSPFAMTYGGEELGGAMAEFSRSTQAAGSLLESLAGMSGLMAGFERRNDGWQHEVDMAAKDLVQFNTQLTGANARLTIAEQGLAIHLKTIAQQQQVANFYGSRFTNVALYSWMAGQLKTAYRQAYGCAYGMAQMAQLAYAFERSGDTTMFLGQAYWSQAQAGLLAGELLLGDLQRMEQSFLETNYRLPEITQSFSLMQIAPAALLNLRQNASAAFSIPELAFDLLYPGQYLRRIKAIRLTIPCITGPYTNIAATLTLTDSQVRLTASAKTLTPLQLKHSTMVAASSAQNDSGVFEFNFRDERYMPFEGAGAISAWQIEFPSGFRGFDYQTISDVILHVSYTAQYDTTLRQNTEQKNGTIAKALQSQTLARVFSLRTEFPAIFNRLIHSALATPLSLAITQNMLPFFIANSTLQPSSAKILLRTAASATGGAFAITVNGTEITNFQPDAVVAGLQSADATAALVAGLFGSYSLAVTQAGGLAPAAPLAGDASALDETKLLDMLIYVEYQLAQS